MNKVFNILFFLLILIFFFYTYRYYSSNKNLKEKHYNRKNINQIINNKIKRLEILAIFNLVTIVIRNGMKILGVSLPEKM